MWIKWKKRQRQKAETVRKGEVEKTNRKRKTFGKNRKMIIKNSVRCQLKAWKKVLKYKKLRLLSKEKERDRESEKEAKLEGVRKV